MFSLWSKKGSHIQWVVGLAGKWATTPIRMRTSVRIPGSALIGRVDNIAYVGNTPTPRIRIKPGGR